jgi:hypothetical protein
MRWEIHVKIMMLNKVKVAVTALGLVIITDEP